MTTKTKVHVKNLGLIDYKQAWDLQTSIHQDLISLKRDKPPMDANVGNTLILCEHPPVYTLGKSGKEDHLIWDAEKRELEGVTFYKINRGGDITYHGPGQLVAYPVFDLDQFFTDVHRYVRFLEEAVIRTLAEYEVIGHRMEGYTGVWIQDEKGNRKICAIGVHLSRWVSMHGLAFNIDPQLHHFDGIVPCGIAEDDKAVTSLSKELKRSIKVSEVIPRLTRHFQELFEFDIVQ